MRRIQTSLLLTRLTVGDGQWLAQTLPALQGRARPAPGAVRLEHIALRYRSGRLGIADALDATEALLHPFAAAGAQVERRHEWYIADDDDDDDDDSEHDDVGQQFTGPLGPPPTWWISQIRQAGISPVDPRSKPAEPEDLLVTVRAQVDASAEDAGAAALYWALLGLRHDRS